MDRTKHDESNLKGSRVLQRIVRICVIFAALWLSVNVAAAKSIRLAVPQFAAKDPLVLEFDSDKILAKANIDVVITPVESSSSAVQALLKGQVDLALFTLEAFNESQPPDAPTLSRLMLQPFQFDSNTELFAVQKTPFGEAILAEVNRANLFPLTFWNQGLSRIIAKTEVKTVGDFNGLTIGAPSKSAANVLERLGADLAVISGSAIQKAMQDGKIDASEVPPARATPDFVRAVKGYSVIPDIRPMVGVLAAAFGFWDGLSEKEKQLVAQAADTAAEKARSFLLETERKEIRKFSDIDSIIYTRFSPDARNQLRSISVKAYIENQPQRDPERQLELLERSKALAQREGSKKNPSDGASSFNSAEISLPIVPVFFATDRINEQNSDLKYRFGSRRADHPQITCGRIAYNKQLGRKSGDVFSADFGLTRGSERLGVRECAALIRTSGVRGPLIIFIHGYNYTFEDAVRRAIAFADDISFSGALLLWSWPSYGRTYAYFRDEVASVSSGPFFSDLLGELSRGNRNQAIDIVSHSMGARVALEGLERALHANARMAVRSLVFLAPDEDRLTFEQKIKRIREKKAGYTDATLYGSAHDRAIRISEFIHLGPRAGSGGSDLLVIEDVDPIDTSPVLPFSLIGHGYAFEHRRILDDLRMLLIARIRTFDERRGLIKETNNMVPYWKFKYQ